MGRRFGRAGSGDEGGQREIAGPLGRRADAVYRLRRTNPMRAQATPYAVWMGTPKPFADHFASVASSYAAFRPRYPTALLDWLVAEARGDAQLWDVACGSGQATFDLAPRFAQTRATDASEQQITQAVQAQAAALVSASSGADRISFAVARADDSGLEEGSADLITVAQALHWFDLPRFYAEVRRVLRPASGGKPGGLFAAWCYAVFSMPGQTEAERRIDAVLQRLYHETLGPFWPAERRLVEEGYATLDFPFVVVPVPPMELTVEWTLPQLAGYLRSWSATARYIEWCRVDPIAPVEQELAALWGEPGVARTVRWPLAVRAGRVPG